MRTPARRLGELRVTPGTPIVCVDVFCGVRGVGFQMDKAGRSIGRGNRDGEVVQCRQGLWLHPVRLLKTHLTELPSAFSHNAHHKGSLPPQLVAV